MTPSPSGSGSGSGPGSPSGSGADGRRASGGATPSGFISRYQILDKIGQGGMGALFLARDPAIDRLLAIKLLRRGFDTEELRCRFSREAKAAGRLRHPNIVTIFDVGEHEGDPFIAMEFLAGETLDELIRHGARLSLARRLKLLEELCDGLSYAHRAGIVHRDVKPANLIVDSEGILKILDFGIVRFEEGGSTAAGMLVGTVNYMSPEQVNGGEIDHRSDIFAVGLVAYELLTARQAFPGTMKQGLLGRIVSVEYERLSSVLPQLDPGVTAIVERAMQREPADRYQDLAKMRNDLVRVRQRIEAMEERAVEAMTSDGGETAFVPAPGFGPPAVAPKPSAALQAAETALEKGDYRSALTLAGRSAASDPRDRQASGVLARAEAALLERGRSLESSGAAAKPPSGAVVPSAAAPGSGAVVPSGAVASSGTYAAQAAHPLLWALLGAVVILVIIVAGVVVPPLLSGPDDANAPPPTSAPEQQAQPPSAPPSQSEPFPPTAEPPAAAPDRLAVEAEPPGRGAARVEPPARRPRTVPPPSNTATPPPSNAGASAPPAPSEPAAPALARAGRDVPVPRRTNHVEPHYPAAALESRTQGTVRIEVTIARDGRVADARVIESVRGLDEAALAAVRRWEFASTYVGGTAVPVLHVVDVDFTPPARPTVPGPGSVQPPAQQPSSAQVRESGSPAARKPATETLIPPLRGATPIKPDPAAGPAGVREALRRYEAAWESRDAAALARVQQLSGDELARVRATMTGAVEYGMEIAVQSIQLDPDGRRATAVCSIARRFRPRIGGKAEQRTATNTLALERRGDAWIIVGIR